MNGSRKLLVLTLMTLVVSSKFNKGQEKANKDHPTMNSQMSAFLPREDY